MSNATGRCISRKRTTQMTKKNRRAFTLIEILVVVAIIATLASVVVLTLSGKTDEAREARAKSDISTLETAVEAFRLDMRRYPAQDEGLAVLVHRPETEEAGRWKGPYVKRLIRDPWDTPYGYVYPGPHNENSFDLLSYGADKQEGGEGINADIGNWETDAEQTRP